MYKYHNYNLNNFNNNECTNLYLRWWFCGYCIYNHNINNTATNNKQANTDADSCTNPHTTHSNKLTAVPAPTPAAAWCSG